MILVLVLLNFVFYGVCDVNDMPCALILSIDISDGFVSGDNILKDNVTYTPTDYFRYNDTIRGCICNLKHCMRKCCPKGQIFINAICSDHNYVPDFPVHELSDETQVKSNHFHVLHGSQCTPEKKNKYMLNPVENDEDRHYLQKNGSVFIESDGMFLQPEDYCMEVFENLEYNISSLICFAEEDNEEEIIMYNTGKKQHLYKIFEKIYIALTPSSFYDILFVSV